MKPTNLTTVTLGELPDLVAMLEDKIRNADRAFAQILEASDLSEATNLAQAAKEELCYEGGRKSASQARIGRASEKVCFVQALRRSPRGAGKHLRVRSVRGLQASGERNVWR